MKKTTDNKEFLKTVKPFLSDKIIFKVKKKIKKKMELLQMMKTRLKFGIPCFQTL